MEDITIIYITASEIKESFATKARELIFINSLNAPIISISRKPLDFGKNIIDRAPKSLSNIYYQILKAATIVDTKYVAIAEDDVFYSSDHFFFCRPKEDEFLYNQNRFALFTWGEPVYSWRDRVSNCSLIAQNKLLVEALEERFNKFPKGTPDNITGELGRDMVSNNLGTRKYKLIKRYSEISIIQFNHDKASEERQRNHKKKLGQIKCYDLYHWGKAEKLRKIYADN